MSCCRVQVVEYLVQILLTGALILTQKWLLGAVHLAVTAYLIHIYLKRRLYMEAADAFRQLGKMKQWRLTVFVVYCLAFVFTTYRQVCTLCVVLCSRISGRGRIYCSDKFRFRVPHLLRANMSTIDYLI